LDYEAKDVKTISCLAIRNIEPAVIRICKENEMPTDIVFHTIFPIVIGLLLISFLASLCLQFLGDDLELYRWLKIVSPSLIKNLLKLKLFNQVLDSGKTNGENEQKEKENLFESILMDLIRRADPTTLNHQDKQSGKL
jgi:hypothetical protein